VSAAVGPAKSLARKDNGASGRGRNKRDALPDYWQAAAPDVRYGEERFRVTVFRGEMKDPKDRKVGLDEYVDAVTWEDASPILRGTLTLQKSEGRKPLAVYEGHSIRLEAAPRQGGKYRRIWDMRILDSNITGSTGTHVFNLADELAWLAKSRDDFSFRKSKGKKQSDATKYRATGWTADQITREVCRTYGVKVGKLAKGFKRINNLTEMNASPLDVIMKAYKLERNYSGRKFVVRMRGGELQVVALRRSKTMLIVGQALLEATIQRSLRKNLATAAHVRGTTKGAEKKSSSKDKTKKGTKVSKLEVDVVAKKAAARYGYIHRNISLEDPVNSKTEARKEGKAELVKSMRPLREVTFDHPGISTLFRGDAVKLRLPEMGLTELVYVTGVSHSVANGEYTMSVTCKFSDPYIDKKGEEIQEKQCEKARKHGRTPPGFCGGSKRLQPTRAENRKDGGTQFPARAA
jgi:hypothetical protein